MFVRQCRLLYRSFRRIQVGMDRLVCRILPAVAIAFVAANIGQAAQAEENVYTNTLPSTTWIITSNADGQTSTGTGVFIDAEKKLVLTNAHVVGDSRSAVVFFPEVKNGVATVKRKDYLKRVLDLAGPGRVVAIDRRRDLALIQLESVPSRAKAIELADKPVTPGNQVDLIGNPGGSDVLWVYTSGTVRSVYAKKFKSDHGDHDFRVVETQTPIRPGDSGGPVVNGEGKLVAIAQSFSPSMNLVSYCVDISEINAFVAGNWKPAPVASKRLLDDAAIEHTVHATGHYKIARELGSGATQDVFVAKDTEYFQRADVRKVWSLVSVAKNEPSTELMMRLMRQSSVTKIGGWAVEKNQAGEFMIMYVAKLDATAPDEALEGTIEYVARIAGAMSGQLNPKTEAKTASETLAGWLAD